jgi:hypothetical protein
MRSARKYVNAVWMPILGVAAFVGGAVIAVVSPVAGAGVVVGLLGWLVAFVGSGVSGVNAYRAVRSTGEPRFNAFRRSGTFGYRWTRYKECQSLLRRDG